MFVQSEVGILYNGPTLPCSEIDARAMTASFDQCPMFRIVRVEWDRVEWSATTEWYHLVLECTTEVKTQIWTSWSQIFQCCRQAWRHPPRVAPCASRRHSRTKPALRRVVAKIKRMPWLPRTKSRAAGPKTALPPASTPASFEHQPGLTKPSNWMMEQEQFLSKHAQAQLVHRRDRLFHGETQKKKLFI